MLQNTNYQLPKNRNLQPQTLASRNNPESVNTGHINLLKEKKKKEEMGKVWCLHDLGISPENTVLMEIIRRIKPEIVSLFSSDAGASIAINISLNPPIFASNITQELKVYFIMILLKHVTIWHLQTKSENSQLFIDTQARELANLKIEEKIHLGVVLIFSFFSF